MANAAFPGTARAPSSTRGNAVPLSIPRNPTRDSGGRDSRPSTDSRGESHGHDGESRSSFGGRFQSPKTGRFSGEGLHNSLGAESSSPFSYLKRPKEMRKGPSSVPESCFPVRREGFDTAAPAAPSPQPFSSAQQSFQSEPSNLRSNPSTTASPSKAPGLLSRTFSSGTNNEAMKEKLEHCLESKGSMGDDLDGESIIYLRQLQQRHSIFASSAVSSAFKIASFSYNDKDRGQPVLKQCVETACILAELGADETSVASALLKDVLLKSMMTEVQLRNLVSPAVVDLVIKVGRLDDLCQVRNDMMKASSRGDLDPKASQMFSHLLLTMADVHGVLIKLADRLAAIRKAASSLGEPGAEVAAEALEVFAPIANQLGVWSIKAELEDLAFKILHPAEHLELHGKLKESQDRGRIESALDRLSGALEENGVEGVDLSGRPKNLYGIMRKMKDKQKGLKQVYDVRALRVIVKSKADCYRVLQQVNRIWPEVDGRFKDYIRNPKPNGYQSIHTVVQLPDQQPIEIQIRTDKMHFIAEYGVAAHWRYKQKEGAEKSISETQQVNWARWLVSWTLELNDAKCRPSGSPPGSSVLSKLANQICNFPSHNPGCKFSQYASKVLPRPISEADLAKAPPTVIYIDHRLSGSSITSLRELPPRCTVGQLHSVLGLSAGTDVLVNMEAAVDRNQVLLAGDRVEVCLPPANRRLTQQELDVQRERLQRIMGSSPASSQSHRARRSSLQPVV